MSSLPASVDQSGVVVITGGASGFGLNVAERFVRAGVRVAILDVSADELASGVTKLTALAPGGASFVLGVQCNVTSSEECVRAAASVAAHFPGTSISFLFNNAGISGKNGGGILGGAGGSEAWTSIFSVNVFGSVNIIKAFVPAMIEAGPLGSGKKTFVVTTTSVVGLLNHNIGPYSVSKMAATAVAEQFAIELSGMGAKAAHISPHSLHPTVAATGFLNARDADGAKSAGDGFMDLVADGGMGADDIVDGLFTGMDADLYYIIVDDPQDVPTVDQLKMRLEDQVTGARPRRPEQLGQLLKLADPASYKARMEGKKKKSLAARL